MIDIETIKDGGPSYQMTLRDWFAGQPDITGSTMLISLDEAQTLIGPAPDDAIGKFKWQVKLLAALRYIAADAMIEARLRSRGADVMTETDRVAALEAALLKEICHCEGCDTTSRGAPCDVPCFVPPEESCYCLSRQRAILAALAKPARAEGGTKSGAGNE